MSTNNVCTSDSLSKKLGVSRTTTIKDLKEVKQILKNYSLVLKSKPGIGYKIVGNEDDVRRLIVELLLLSLETCKLVEMLNSFDEKVFFNSQGLGDVSPNIKIKDIKKAIKKSKEKFEFWIPDSSYVSLIFHIAIALDRLIKGQEIELPLEKINMVKQNKEYMLAKEIGDILSGMYHVVIPEAEIVNITIHLLSANLKLNYLHNENIFSEDNLIGDAVDEMIDSIRGHLISNEENVQSLKVDLLAHLKLTVKRHRLNIKTENPLIEKVKESYKELYPIADQMAQVFEKRTNIFLSDHEISYITLYLAAHSEVIERKDTKRVLVVCTTGKGSAKILSARLKNNIPEIKIKALVSIFELEDKRDLMEDVDLIISTVESNIFEKPFLKVSPLITAEEIQAIRMYIHRSTDLNNQRNGNIGTSSDFINDKTIKSFIKETRSSDLKRREIYDCYFTDELLSSKNQNRMADELVEKTAVIMTEIANMFTELDISFSSNKDMNIWGIILHIIMAIPRWESGRYNEETDIEKYKTSYGQSYEVIRKYLNKISRDHGLIIPDSEVISILRYLI